MARDLAHSRPHKVTSKVLESPLSRFESSLRKSALGFEEDIPDSSAQSAVILGDCRQLPLADESVHLIVTSPPYANALDYMRAHKFSLVWMGYSTRRLSGQRREYIGSEVQADVDGVELPDSAVDIIRRLGERDTRRSKVLDKYLREMTVAMSEMYRVLQAGRAAVIVVGPSTMRGLRIHTHDHIAAIARSTGFELVGMTKRTINRDRRMMPARRDSNGMSSIEQRIHEEYVIGLVKPEIPG